MGSSRRLWALGVAVGVRPAAVAASVVLPGAGGLSGRWPWVAVVSFRGSVAVLAAACALVAGVAVLVVRRHRVTRTVFAALTVVGVLAAAGELTVMGVRGYFPVHPGGAAPVDGLTVVVTNTEHSGADAADLARLYLSVGADVISMPETDPTLAADVAQRLRAAGATFQVFGVAGQGYITPTSLLVSDRLGRYRQVNADGDDIGEVMAEPVGGAAGRPTLVAVHPQAPVSPYFTPIWAADTHRAVATCRDSADVILAGDFNSSVDHPALRNLGGCADAAQAVGASAVATWPQWLPRFFGASLDHVITTRARWRPVAAWVEPIVGSDHRALVTRLLPAVSTTAVDSWSTTAAAGDLP
jgi:endonuclease/exonuclease/phosphatase (EEP) superfamily protein YafD